MARALATAPAAPPMVRPPAGGLRPARASGASAAATARRYVEVGDEAVVDRRPTLEVVGPRRRLSAGPTVALGATIAFAIAFVIVACQALLVQGQQRLDRLEADITASTDRYHELRLEVAELEAPDQVIAAATELGMVPPAEVIYLTPDAATPVEGPGGSGDADALDTYAQTRPNLGG